MEDQIAKALISKFLNSGRQTCPEYQEAVTKTLPLLLSGQTREKCEYKYGTSQYFSYESGIAEAQEIYEEYQKTNFDTNTQPPTLNNTKSGWKFRGNDENTLSILINQEIWFSSPKFLNDPFDSSADLQLIYLKLANERKARGLKIYGNDDSPGPYTFYAQKYGWQNLIFSFSRTLDNTLMWSHYTNSHQGISIGFDFTNDKNIEGIRFAEVNYGKSVSQQIEEMLDFHQSYREQGRNKQMRDENDRNLSKISSIAFTTKGEEWAYEKEIRFVKEVNDTKKVGESVKFNPNSIKTIIFGCKCPKRFKSSILNILKFPHYSHVEIYETSADSNNNKLRYRLVK